MRRRTLAPLAVLPTLALIALAPPPARAAVDEVITVDAAQDLGTLTKAGLGTLFGVTSMPDTPADLAAGSQISLSQHQSAQGDASYPSSTEAVAAKMRSSGVKMIGRYNDLMGGWPYQWKGTADWYAKVDSATRSIQSYRDTLYAVAPFNEPDNKLQGGFGTDASVPGSTYDQKFFWLWTQTFKRIRAIDATIPIMGPNFELYRPWEAGYQERMRGFLSNAVATNTVPNLIGWHSLGPSPGDVPEALKYYRPLENELNVPNRPLPLVVEEYGPGTGDFEGVPGTMVKHWAEFERVGVRWASMGIYTNPGLLGNTLRRTSAGLKPNGGWHMMNWYKNLPGRRIFVSRWDTRHYQAADGLAAWDSGSRTLTALVGGQDANVDVRVNNLRDKLGGSVRVRLESTIWDPGTASVQRGGDPQTGTYTLYDKTMTVDAAGGVTVPIHRMEGYNGYRIRISAPAAAEGQSTLYEAERAAITGAVVHNGADARALASGDGYVGGIDAATSAVTFTVNAPSAGMYVMRVRYAAAAAGASHTVTVNGAAQGSVAYPNATAGWADSELRTATKRVVLAAGANRIALGKGNSSAELDAIDVRPDTHRYEAEDATVTAARVNHYGYNEFPDLVGGLDSANSSVEFTVDAPRAGSYRLEVGYGNGTGSTSTHTVLVNGGTQGTVSYPTTGAWLTTNRQDTVLKRATVTVQLNAGSNRVMLRKADGYAEIDYLTVAP